MNNKNKDPKEGQQDADNGNVAAPGTENGGEQNQGANDTQEGGSDAASTEGGEGGEEKDKA